jgi:hypothetical protein
MLIRNSPIKRRDGSFQVSQGLSIKRDVTNMCKTKDEAKLPLKTTSWNRSASEAAQHWIHQPVHFASCHDTTKNKEYAITVLAQKMEAKIGMKNEPKPPWYEQAVMMSSLDDVLNVCQLGASIILK